MARETGESGETKSTKLKKHKRKSKKEGKTRTVHANILYDHTKGGDNPNRHYANNKIKTTKYTLLSFLPKNLFEQFHRFANVYFVFIALLNFVPVVNAFNQSWLLPLWFFICQWPLLRIYGKITGDTARIKKSIIWTASFTAGKHVLENRLGTKCHKTICMFG